VKIELKNLLGYTGKSQLVYALTLWADGGDGQLVLLPGSRNGGIHQVVLFWSREAAERWANNEPSLEGYAVKEFETIELYWMFAGSSVAWADVDPPVYYNEGWCIDCPIGEGGRSDLCCRDI
jgi:hypothetical protein